MKSNSVSVPVSLLETIAKLSHPCRHAPMLPISLCSIIRISGLSSFINTAKRENLLLYRFTGFVTLFRSYIYRPRFAKHNSKSSPNLGVHGSAPRPLTLLLTRHLCTPSHEHHANCNFLSVVSCAWQSSNTSFEACLAGLCLPLCVASINSVRLDDAFIPP